MDHKLLHELIVLLLTKHTPVSMFKMATCFIASTTIMEGTWAVTNRTHLCDKGRLKKETEKKNQWNIISYYLHKFQNFKHQHETWVKYSFQRNTSTLYISPRSARISRSNQLTEKLKLNTTKNHVLHSTGVFAFFHFLGENQTKPTGSLKRWRHWRSGSMTFGEFLGSFQGLFSFAESLLLAIHAAKGHHQTTWNGNGKSWWKKMCVYTCVYICICMFNVHVYYIYTACTVHMHVYVTCQILGCRWSDRQNEDFGFGEGLGNCAQRHLLEHD